jgi:GNAT superfamily N-acetyltransferase
MMKQMTILPSGLSEPESNPAEEAREQPGPASQRRQRSWIPVRSLSPRHRDRIVAHLQSLSEHDRYLRFGYPASNEHIERYADSLDFDRDEVFGIFNRRLRMIAMAHLACNHVGSTQAEFGVSVNGTTRGRGLGARLFDHACLHARNRGVDTLVIHALTQNAPMMKIVRNAGATIESQGGEAEARVRLAPESLVSKIDQWVDDHAAELDYQIKVQSNRVDRFLDSLTQAQDDTVRPDQTTQP